MANYAQLETVHLTRLEYSTLIYKALQTLQKECEESDKVYCYMDKLADMIDSDNIDEYLKHIEDVKPITTRQCIKLLPMIAKNKPELKCDIVSALQKADISIYADSMQSLVFKDIESSLAEIENL